jgi:hypothetical protein
MTKEDFKNQWAKQLEDIKHILDFLTTYPQVLKQLEFEDLLTSDELLKSQMDWVRICSKYEGMEKDFFKPYWVPIQKSSLSYFIDLSNPNYPIFKSSFIFSEPYSYEKMNLFESINELMLLGDSDVNIEGITTEFKDRLFKQFCTKIYNNKKK